MSNIMVLRSEAKNLLDAFDEHGAEDNVLDMLAKLEQTGVQAVVPLCDLIEELEARAKARKDRARELSDLAKKDEEMLTNAKKTIIKISEIVGQKKFTSGSLTVTVSSGRESVTVVDESVVPTSYKKGVIKVDGWAIQSIMDALPEAVLGVETIVDKAKVMDDVKKNIIPNGVIIEKKPYVIIKG